MKDQVVNQHDGTEWVVSPPGEIHPFLEGDQAAQLAAVMFAPPKEEIRRMLLAVRKQLGWSQAWAAATFGVSKSCVVKWESGERSPNGAAAKLIFLFYNLWVDKSKKVLNAWDLLFWGGWPCREEPSQVRSVDEALAVEPTYFVAEKVIFEMVSKANGSIPAA